MVATVVLQPVGEDKLSLDAHFFAALFAGLCP